LEGGGCTVLICAASRWTIVDTVFLHFARLLPFTALKKEVFRIDRSVYCEVGNKRPSKTVVNSGLQTGKNQHTVFLIDLLYYE